MASDYSLNFANKLVSLFAGLVLSIILARYLGVEMRGEYAYIMQLGSLLGLVLGLGLGASLPFFYRQDPGYYAVFRTLVVVIAAVSLLGVGAILAVTGWSLLALIAITTVIAMLYQQAEAAMAVVNIRLKIYVNILFSMLKLCLLGLGVVIFMGSDSLHLTVAVATMWIAWLAVVIVDFWRGVPRARWAPVNMATAVPVLAYSWLPMLTSVLIVLNYSVTLLLVRYFLDAEQTGLFAVAAGLVTYLWVVADAFKEVLVSRVVRTKSVASVRLPMQVALVVTALGTLVLAAASGSLIVLLFGADYENAAIIAVVLSLGSIPMVVYKLLGVVVLSHGRRVFYFVSLLLACLLNIVLSVGLIPAVGVVGGAVAAVLGYWATGIMFLIYFVREFGLSVGELMIPRRQDVARLVWWKRN